MALKSFCLSFEIKNDNTTQMYSWLRAHHALECGNTVAFVPDYEYELNFVKEITKDLESIGEALVRAYILFSDEESHMRGGFIIGQRHDNLWDEKV